MCAFFASTSTQRAEKEKEKEKEEEKRRKRKKNVVRDIALEVARLWLLMPLQLETATGHDVKNEIKERSLLPVFHFAQSFFTKTREMTKVKVEV